MIDKKDFDIITPKEASVLLHCSEYTLRDKVRRKRIPHFRVGKRIFFRRSTLLKWIEDQEAINSGDF